MKVATVNVHGWLDGYDGINVDGLGCKLRQIGPDILVLQEVSMLLNSSYVEQLFNTVGLEYNSVVDQQKHPTGFKWGVAVGSRYPLSCQVVHTTSSGRQRIIRCTMNNFEIVAVHLDHADEGRRMHQLGLLFDSLRGIKNNNYPEWDNFEYDVRPVQAYDDSTARLIVGDFNALSKDDYTMDEWNNIVITRRNNYWENPMTLVTSTMATLYSDCWTISPSIFGDTGTCRFNTHIDYIYANDKFLAMWYPTSCNHIKTKCTDHCIVVVEFKKN